MSNSQPTVSVIIPTYNRAAVLRRALDSVWKQSYRDFELLVVDDGSTDETKKVVLDFQEENNIPFHFNFNFDYDFDSEKFIFIQTENRGVSAARNLGMQKAKGKWMAFLDSDDEWLPQKLAKQMLYAEKHPEIKIIHGEELWVRRGVRVNPKKKHQKFGGRIFLKCLPLCLISPSAVMIERSVFEQVGMFREDFPVCEDYDLWLKITSLYEVGFIEDPLLVKYGGHDDQLSSKFKAMDYWRVKALQGILKERELSADERTAVLKEMEVKGHILLQGYRKHQGEEVGPEYDEVKKILKEFQLSIQPQFQN